MTGVEMVYNFQQLLVTISPDFYSKERLNTYETLEYLNRTIDRYIKTKFLGGSSFKENTNILRASSADLRELISTTDGANTAETFIAVPGMTGAYTTDLPADFMAYIRSDTKITRITVLACTSQWVPNQEIDYHEIDGVLTTPFNTPILEKPLVTLREDDSITGNKTYTQGLLVIVDSYTTPLDYIMTYVKTPTPITMLGDDCQLPEYLHEEIVRLAVDMYLLEYKMKLQQAPKDK